MADAAKSARGSFEQIKDGAKEMTRETGGSMMEARHGVMMLGEEFGVHLPRGVTMFISSLGPVQGAMAAAFPFLAIALGATILIEKLMKIHEEGEKLTESQARFAVATQNAFTALDEKLLQAGIKADELNGDHLAALHKTLELIDRQSMAELVHAFDEVSKAADVVFTELKGHVYSLGIGSDGAKHALEDFKRQYDLLLAQGKDKDAADLLKGTRESAERVLELQKQAKANQTVTGSHALKQYGVGITEKEVQSQQVLVDALRTQADVQDKVNALKRAQSSNAVQTTGKTMDTEAAAMERQQEQQRRAEERDADKAREENYRQAVERLQQSEKEKIEATEKGSAARLAAISSAIKEEERYGLQETGYYRSLLTDRVALIREMSDEEARQREQAGQEEAQHAEKMAGLMAAAQRMGDQLQMAQKRTTDQERVAAEIAVADAEYEALQMGFSKQIDALNKHGNDYQNKLKAIQNKEKELTQAHENAITSIKDKAEEERVKRTLEIEDRLNSTVARDLTQSIMGHQTWARMVQAAAQDATAGLMQAGIKYAMELGSHKDKEAAEAARAGWLAGMKFPFPASIAMAPILAATGFETVMGFQGGGKVPGVENGDVVNARLEPGETIIPKKMTERLERAASDGDGDNDRKHIHIHHSPTYNVQAIDGASVRGMLEKHSSEFEKHAKNVVRKLNR